MNRTAIKTFATWARQELRQQAAAKAARFGVTVKAVEEPQYVSGGMTVAGFTYNATATERYKGLRHDLHAKLRAGASHRGAVEALIDEMAYTWFNRLTALRYMEVNGYIGRALSSSTEGRIDPDLLRDATQLVQAGEFGGVTLAQLDRWRERGDDEVYRNLLTEQCANLAEPLPFLFGDKPYAPLFVPDHLLTPGSVLRRLVSDIPEDAWRQGVEIIGWLYQFYISERKDEVMAAKGAYDARDIPAATQLFTPHWIVRYMVENSVGRLWLEAHPESKLREHMPYYLDSESSEGEGGQTDKPSAPLTPQDLTVLDPACGSGHILVYAFDLLFHIYAEAGYSERDIPALILKHNLYGLDIDERAAQLARFALLMRARGKTRRVLRDPPPLNLTHTVPTQGWALPNTRDLNPADWQPLLDAFKDADNLGSLITPPELDYSRLEAQLAAFEASGRLEVSADAPRLRHLLTQARLLTKRYSAVVANPPYMGSGSFNKAIKEFVQKNYQEGKQDLYGVYILRNLEFSAPGGVVAMLTIPNWMFLSSFEGLRDILLKTSFIESMVHNGRGVFGSDFGSCSFTVRKSVDKNRKGTYKRLFDKHVNVATNEELEKRFFERSPFYAKSGDFEKIPGSPIAYWVSEKVLEAFDKYSAIENLADTRKGLATGNNNRFVRDWFEINWSDIKLGATSREEAAKSERVWFPMNDGGPFRRWYGNHGTVVNWENDGQLLQTEKTEDESRIRATNLNLDYIFKPSVSWSQVTSAFFSARITNSGYIFSNAGTSVFAAEERLKVLLSLLNSKVATTFLGAISPTLNFNPGEIGRVPVASTLTDTQNLTVEKLSRVTQTDWDNFETSWDFQTHPLLRHDTPRLATAFECWHKAADEAFFELKRLEQENNRYWIDAYGLQDELSPEVPEDQITIRRADLERDVKSLLSYAVGCMMGRYSLDTPGLRFAGGEFDLGDFTGDFVPDADGILPITDEDYFEDDLVSRFSAFLAAAYGEARLQENLEFVANALAKRSGETALERLRRYFLTEFVSDHVRTYSKRPIYWLFTSGKERAFGALVYLHRYTPDTLAALRNGYVLPLQRKLSAEIGVVEQGLAAASSASASKTLQKRLAHLKRQLAELASFQDRLQHLADLRVAFDLDDGVAYNYTLLEGLLYEGTDLKMDDLKKRSEWKRELLAGF